jgi:hypothetical protein
MRHPSTSQHLFNLVQPDPGRPDFSVYFYAGDILSLKTDILVLSAYQGAYFPVPDTVLGHLAGRFGFSIFPEDLTRVHPCVAYIDPDPSLRLPCKRICVIERRNEISNKDEASMQMFSDMREGLPRVLRPEDKSISLPLLGTGSQNMSKALAAIELLNISSQLSRSSLQEIRIFAYDFEAIGLLNTRIEQYLKRDSGERIPNRLLEALVDELAQIKPLCPPRIQTEIEQLLQLLGINQISIAATATIGRIIAENLMILLAERTGISLRHTSGLEAYIRELQPILLSDTYPRYTLSYLRLLQALGNHASHANATPLSGNDIVAACIAIIRLIHTLEIADHGTADMPA